MNIVTPRQTMALQRVREGQRSTGAAPGGPGIQALSIAHTFSHQLVLRFGLP